MDTAPSEEAQGMILTQKSSGMSADRDTLPRQVPVGDSRDTDASEASWP